MNEAIKGLSSLAEVSYVHSKLRAQLQQQLPLYTSNLLIQAYGRCGGIEQAAALFQSLGSSSRNSHSWKLMLKAYIQCRRPEAAAATLAAMPAAARDAVCCTGVISLCSRHGLFSDAAAAFTALSPSQVDVPAANAMLAAIARHSHHQEEVEHFFRFRMPAKNSISWNTYLAAAAGRRDLQLVEHIFHSEIPARTMVSWNTVLSAYCDSGDSHSASHLVAVMPEWSILTWNTLLYGARHDANRIDAAFHTLMPGRDLVSWTTYASVNEEAFDRMPVHDAVARTGMLAALARRGEFDSAWNACKQLGDDTAAWNSLAAALVDACRHADAEAAFQHNPRRNFMSWNGLLAARVDSSAPLLDCQAVFHKMPQHSSVSCNTMMSAYAQNVPLWPHTPEPDCSSHSLHCSPDVDPSAACLPQSSRIPVSPHSPLAAARRIFFTGMQQRDVVSWASILQAEAAAAQGIARTRQVFDRMPLHGTVACTTMLEANAQAGYLHLAKAIFDGLPIADIVVWNTMLASMAKSGETHAAAAIFHAMPARDIISWSALLAAYSRAGNMVNAATTLVADMSLEGLDPGGPAFVSLLSACSHAGDVQGVRTCWLAMHDYGVVAQRSHLGCIVDALARAGRLHEAMQLRIGDEVEAASLLSAHRNGT